MKEAEYSSDNDLPLTVKEQIDALCLEFEDLWQRQEAAEIGSFMSRVEPAARGPLLVELLLLDITYRRCQELPCDRPFYGQQFPEHDDVIQVAFARLKELDAISDLAPGTKIGRYEIGTKIGSGGFATVYRAYDHELQRHVAIKSLRRDRESRGTNLLHLLEEARTVARLSHPSIVPLHDVVQADGDTYLVMACIPGNSLRIVLSRTKLSVIQAIKLGIVVCDALSHAHQAGVTHRDLKPGNILLDAKGKIFITDFGLAIHDSRRHTLESHAAGSIAYMSPEQLQGDLTSLDGRSDIWSVGVVLYEILSGQRPFRGASASELTQAIQTWDYKPLRQLDPSIPVRLAEMVDRCLRKLPSERYQTAADVAAELRELLKTLLPQDRVKSKRITFGFRAGVAFGAGIGLIGILTALAIPGKREADRREIHDKLESIGQAFQLHHNAFGYFSQPHTPDDPGELSWRVHLLPFLGHQQLYEQFNLREPWHSAQNQALLDHMPEVFRLGTEAGHQTRIRVVTGPGSIFAPGTLPRYASITDGMANTILALVSREAVPWTKPDEFDLLGSLAKPLEINGVECLMADGSLLSLPEGISLETVEALATPNGGELIDAAKLRQQFGPRRQPSPGRDQELQSILAAQLKRERRLKQIALAMHAYHDLHRHFPIAAPLPQQPTRSSLQLSWRVHLLPFLDQRPLYDQFHLDEPWDSPHNITLLPRIPDVFVHADGSQPPTTTRITVVTGTGTPFDDREPLRLREFKDGTQTTILIVECGYDKAVPWTKPEDIVFDPASPLSCLGKYDTPGFMLATADAAVGHLKTSVPPQLFGALVTPSGQEVVSGNLQNFGLWK